MGMNSLDAKIYADIVGTFLGATDYGSLGLTVDRENKAVTMSYGTGAYQGDKLYTSTISIALSDTLEIDLTGGSIKDPFGSTTLNFATVKLILVKASKDNVNDIIMGNAAANGFVGPLVVANDKAVCRPDGRLLFCAPVVGWPVTAGTGDILRFANGGAGTAVVFDLAILGTSA